MNQKDLGKELKNFGEIFGLSETDNALLQLKEETAGRIVEKYCQKKGDLALLVSKPAIVDYIVDGGFFDSLGDRVVKQGIELFSSSLDDLKTLRDGIKDVSTEKQLQAFEADIMDQLEKGGPLTVALQGYGETSSENSGGNGESTESVVSISNSFEGSAEVGEAKKIPLGERMQWCFPEGVPQTKKEMEKYLTTIEVPIVLSDGQQRKKSLTVHKKLAKEYYAIFVELKESGIRVNPNTTGCYDWRTMRNSNKMSMHAYGLAFDLNFDVNGGVYGKTDSSSPYFNNGKCVAILKEHGFYWGGDWSAKNYDPMHFTYLNA